MPRWIRATNNKHCPVCNGKSWCSWSDNGSLRYVTCMRNSLGAVKSFVPNNMSATAYLHIIGDGESKPYTQVLKQTNIASIERRHRVYGELLKLSLSAFHKAYLFERGWSIKELDEVQYVSFPETHVRNELVSNLAESTKLEGIPGFFIDTTNTWRFVGGDGILLPVRDEQNHVTGFQINTQDAILRYYRSGKLDVDKTTAYPKYIWLSSAPVIVDKGVSGYIKRKTGVGAEVRPHFSGFSKPEDEFDFVHVKEVIITEGILKADRIRFSTGIPTIGQPGVGVGNNIIAKFVADANAVIVAYDADWRKNDHVKLAMGRLLTELSSLHGNDGLFVAVWDEEFGKGLDDVLQNGFYEQVTFAMAKDWLNEHGVCK